MSISKMYDVVILGGGLAGMTLALRLADVPALQIALCDDTSLEKFLAKGADGRTTAVSAGSAKVLADVGVWQNFINGTYPSGAIKDIDILDGDSDVLLGFSAHDVGEIPFGHVVDNTDLRHALFQKIQEFSNIKHLTAVKASRYETCQTHGTLTFDDGTSVAGKLVIGADGRRSFLRDALGIRTFGRKYDQTAIVALINHTEPHQGLAIERFDANGPFAILPFAPDTRSALVFCVHPRDVLHWMNCDVAEFENALNQKTKGIYGQISLAGKREAWPLSLVKAYSYIGKRSALLAEAAHGMHPVAGQGLNMSLRDIDVIAPLIHAAHQTGQDIGGDMLLQNYQRKRMADNLSMCLVTDGIVAMFSNNIAPIRLARRAGLKMVAQIPFMKRFFMRQAMGRV